MINFHVMHHHVYVFSCVPTLCDPMDCSLPGSSVHGIFQARILEWVATSYSKGSSWPRDRTCVSCISHLGRQILYHFTTSFKAPGVGDGQESLACYSPWGWTWLGDWNEQVLKILPSVGEKNLDIWVSDSFRTGTDFKWPEVNSRKSQRKNQTVWRQNNYPD